MTEGPWVVATCECRVCSHRHISVHPVQCDEDALECPKCHAMSAEVVEYHPNTEACDGNAGTGR